MTTLSLDSVFRRLRETDAYRSIVRHGAASTNRNRSLVVFENLFLHVHPVKVREKTLRFTHTYWLGGIALACALILTATGVLLMFYYHPSVPQAYRDMKELEFVVDNGLFLRNMHRWAAHLMVFASFLHMMRVFFHRAYRPPRQFNWVVGVVLLLVTLLLSYTGYLLPWDQLAFWGVSVGTNMAKEAPLIGEKSRFLLLGGNIVSENALLRFYVLHCVVLPVALLLMLSVHIWRVRKDGGVQGPPEDSAAPRGGPMSSLPPLDLVETADPLATPRRVALVRPDRRPAVRTTDEKYVMTFPNLILREVILFQLVVIGLALAAILFDAPLEGIANPLETPNPAKAPWYFLGLQELLHYFPPVVAGVLMPLLVVVALVVIPYARINQTAGPALGGCGAGARPLARRRHRRRDRALRSLSSAGRSSCRRPRFRSRCSPRAEAREPERFGTRSRR